MIRRRTVIVYLFLLIVLQLPLPIQAQAAREIVVLDASGPLTPVMAEYLERGIASAESRMAEALILRLDTPGGSIDLMNRMVRAIRASKVPVIVYIAPRGAIAGSAGTILTLAGHVAVMAPETAIGAASPVGMQGEELGQTIETKAKEILKATARSLAAWRGEDAVALAEATIDEAKAASAAEALSVGLIDVIANDLDDLLVKLDGRSVLMVSGSTDLDFENILIVEMKQSFIEELLQTLTNPNIVFLLLTIGVQALLIELSSPGGWVAGFIGVVCLSLGVYGLGILPVNWFGIIFLITAFVLFFLEVKAPTHGAMAAAGLIVFIMGSMILFNSPATPAFQRVSISLIIGMGLFTAVFFFVIVSFAIRAQRRPVAVGSEVLIGRTGAARTDLNPVGMVQVGGELWTAELVEIGNKVSAGEQVEVVSVDGLRVRVVPKRLAD